MNARKLMALTRRELLKLRRNPQALATSLLLPILYLLLFGQGFNLSSLLSSPSLPPGAQATVLHTILLGAPDYFSYFAAGMVGFVCVTATLFVGANVIFDKLFGILKRTSASPASPTDIFGARLIAGSLQPVGLAFLVLGLAIGLGGIAGFSGLHVTAGASVVGVGEIVAAVLILAVMFASLFIALGFAFDVPQTYFAVVNAINLPVLLTSAALYPWGAMPHWLQGIASYNPITLAVEVLRETMFGGAYYAYPAWVYLLGLIGWAVLMFTFAVLLVRRSLSPRK